MQTVISKDGAAITFDKSGTGPTLILISTTASDHRDFNGMAAELAKNFIVYNFDWRGRGESDDPQPYNPAREIEDIEALIDLAGGEPSLVSTSTGCVLALDAATKLGSKVTKLFLYEPPFIINDSRPPLPAEYVEHVTQLVKDSKRSEAIEYLMTKAIGVPVEYIEPMKADPSWEIMVKYAHTLVYDGQIVKGTMDGKPLLKDRWQTEARVAVVVGAKSEPFFHDGAKALAELLPNAKYTVLEGQDHGAFWVAADEIAKALRKALKTGEAILGWS